MYNVNIQPIFWVSGSFPPLENSLTLIKNSLAVSLHFLRFIFAIDLLNCKSPAPQNYQNEKKKIQISFNLRNCPNAIHALKVEIQSMRTVRICPHKNVHTYNYILKCVLKCRYTYEFLQLQRKKRKQFCTHQKRTKADDNIHCVFPPLLDNIHKQLCE